MNYRLLYDVAQHSDAPRDAALFGFGIGLLVLISVGVLYFRGLPIGSMGFVVGHWKNWERRGPGSRSYGDYEGFKV